MFRETSTKHRTFQEHRVQYVRTYVVAQADVIFCHESDMIADNNVRNKLMAGRGSFYENMYVCTYVKWVQVILYSYTKSVLLITTG